ncbi:unnamed protein product [Diamesa serratosioi]
MNDRFGSPMGVLCKVCGDRASGKHYGVPSCDGCRGFFKRSIRRNLEYVCKEGGHCIVDVSRRNQCQACRFSKCLKANMRREAVQHERAPKMTTLSPSGLTASHNLSYHHSNYFTSRPHESIFPFQMHLSAPINGFPLDNYYLPSPYYPHLSESLNQKLTENNYKPHLMPPTSSAYNMEIGKLLSSNLFNRIPIVDQKNIVYKKSAVESAETLAKDNEVTSSEETFIPIPSATDTSTMKSTQALYDSATKLLFLAIKWAKSIPSFNQLPITDQRRLLNDSWAELFVIAAAQWGLPIDDEIIKNHPNLEQLQNIVTHFILLKVDHFESACLKALILFRANPADEISVMQQISILQNQTLCLLIEKCGGLRLGHLLLTLPQIRQAGSPQILQEILFKHTIGEVFIERIMDEINEI